MSYILPLQSIFNLKKYYKDILHEFIILSIKGLIKKQ